MYSRFSSLPAKRYLSKFTSPSVLINLMVSSAMNSGFSNFLEKIIHMICKCTSIKRDLKHTSLKLIIDAEKNAFCFLSSSVDSTFSDKKIQHKFSVLVSVIQLLHSRLRFRLSFEHSQLSTLFYSQ